MTLSLLIVALLVLGLISSTWSFDKSSVIFFGRTHCTQPFPLTSIFAAGRGFGKDAEERDALVKSYDKEAVAPIADVIDKESVLNEFFNGYAASWKPLFRSMLSDEFTPTVPIKPWLEEDLCTPSAAFTFDETSTPWRRLAAIPTADHDKTVLGEFLDQVQASLIAIPVDETTKEDDDNDLHFLEEGRRMLVCSRFHVVSGLGSRIEAFDELFATCWNELYHLQNEGESDTGSLIVVPGSDLSDLRRFVDMNLQRPLQAMGLEEVFEVASMTRGSPAIRLLHKLSDIPTDLEDGPQRMGDGKEES